MRVPLVAVLLGTIALAGCSSDPEPATTDEPSTTTTSSTTTTGTTRSATTTVPPPTPDLPVNNPPSASLGVSSEGGDVPFNVTFTIDGADEDGDELSWRLLLGEPVIANGETLPAVYNHTIETPGVYNVTLFVSDGEFEVNQTLVLNTTEAGATDSFSGSWTAGGYGCALRRTAPDPSGDGINYQTFVINPETVGSPYTATLTPTADAEVNMIFTSEAGDAIESLSAGPGGLGAYTLTGIVPADTNWIFWSSCGSGAEVDYLAG